MAHLVRSVGSMFVILCPDSRFREVRGVPVVGSGRTASVPVATGRELRLTERPARFLKGERKSFQMTYRTCACVRNSPFVDRYFLM